MTLHRFGRRSARAASLIVVVGLAAVWGCGPRRAAEPPRLPETPEEARTLLATDQAWLAVEFFIRMGADAVPHLLPSLEKHRFEDRAAQQAIMALQGIGDPAVPALIEALEKHREHEGLRRSLCWTLGTIGDPRAVPPLLSLLKKRSLSSEAESALHHLTGEVDEEDLLSLWGSFTADGWVEMRDRHVRMGADAVKELLPLLEDKGDPVRRRLAEIALVRVGSPAVPALIDELERGPGERRGRRFVWCWILGRIADERAIPVLKKLYFDPEEAPEVKREAYIALWRTTGKEEAEWK
ncbi:MAG TPA: HEAT repeat domain-containing protein [Planctomycetota bacterium]|nr:HEAT repeat domain-containing protein [Planctomycetota bacterium]